MVYPQRFDPMVRPKILLGNLPAVEVTFQLLVELTGDPRVAHDRAIAICLKYFEAKIGDRVSSADHPPDGFVMTDIPGQSLEVASLPAEGTWAARCMYPDSPLTDKGPVAGRTWVTEVGIRCADGRCRVGICVKCASQPYAKEGFLLLRPGLVRELHAAVGLRDQRPLLPTAWVIDDEAELAELAGLLRHPGRSVPVHVLSQTPGESSWLVPPDELADRTLAIAHVVALPARLLSAWNETIGEPLGLLPGAVRSYLPVPGGALEQPSDHPLIVGYLRLDPAGEERSTLKRLLIELSFRHAAERRVDWGDCRFYGEARLAGLERRRNEARDIEDLQAMYEEENATLRRRIDDLKLEVHDYCNLADESGKAHGRAVQENLALKARLENMLAAARQRGAAAGPVPIPTQWTGLEDWVAEHFRDRLFLHPRASQGLKDAEFRDPALAYRALELLATDYRDMKLGADGARPRYEARLGQLGLHEDPATTSIQAGQKGDRMYVEYPPGSGRQELLQMHLKKGVDRDPRNLLRIYYFWDAASAVVVVGWLPGHL
jgi:hypothetical protein